MSEQTIQLVQRIRERLNRTVRRMLMAEAAFGLAVTVAVATGLWALFTALEAALWLPAMARGTLLILAVGGTLVAFGLLAARPLLRLMGVLPPHSDVLVAQRIGSRFPDVGDRLRNLLDLSEGRASQAPESLLDGAVQMLGRQLMPVPFEEVEDFSRPRRALPISVVPVFAVLLFAFVAPGAFFGASERLIAVGTDFVRPAPYALTVLPGDVELVRGADLQAEIVASGRRLPPSVTLAVNHPDEERVERFDLAADSAGHYRHALANVRRPLRYRVESDHVTSRWYQVDVLERPVLRGLQVTLTYPSYAGLGTRRLEPNVGDIAALAGTRVRVEVGLGGQQLSDAYLAFEDGTQVALNQEGATGIAEFTLRRKGSYHVTLVGDRDIRNEEPVIYQTDVLPDAPPAIALFSPNPTTELDRRLAVPVGAQIRDDFGFSDLKLYYRLSESRYKTPSDSFQVVDLPLEDPHALDQTVAYAWELAETTALDPVPGDVVEYYVRVWDNDAWSGFKSAMSERFRLIVPSLAERYRALDEAQDNAEQEVEEILREAAAIRSEFEALQNELRRNQEGTWDNQRQLEQIQNRQAAVEDRVEQLGERLESMTQEMQTNDLVSEETLQMYEELKKVVDEINSPELREALERLQQAMEDLDLQQLQQSLGDFEFNEQQYRQRLERTLELFKRMRVQQQLDEAARRAEELAEQQRRMAERTQELTEESQSHDSDATPRKEAENRQESSDTSREGGNDQESNETATDENQNAPNQEGEHGRTESDRRTAEDLAREQERARQEAQELMDRLEESGAQMDDLRNTSREAMQEFLDELQRQQIPQQMQQNARQLRQQQLQDAQQGQQQMSQQLQQMSASIRDMQQSMSGQSVNLNIAGIRQALEDVLTLSQRQETSRQGLQQLAPDSPVIRDYAQEQVRLAEGLSIVADSLQHLSREIPQMSRTVQQFTGDALREMASATEALADRSARTGAAHQQGAMRHLNELALVLADLMDQMMSGGGGGGQQSMQQMLDQLQQMSGQQQQLNQQIQQFLNDMQGNRLAADAEQRLQQMARQQAEIRQQLRELSRNSEARGKLLGDLNRIADQMEETIQELQAAQADRRTIERQQEILTRLLEAQKSLRERDREERREGRSADDLFRDNPDAMPPIEEMERLRQDLLRALEAGYAPEYQELIKRYFELLQQNQNSPPSEPTE